MILLLLEKCLFSFNMGMYKGIQAQKLIKEGDYTLLRMTKKKPTYVLEKKLVPLI